MANRRSEGREPLIRIHDCFDSRARRTELLSALVRAGGLSPERAARAIRAELATLQADCERVGMIAAAQVARDVAEVVAQLVREDEPVCRDVLVLDDNEITRELLALALETEGHRVRVAGSLDEFVAEVRARRPDVVLSEAHLPGAPADQLCKFLREIGSLDWLPIVIFSSAEGAELERLADNAGAELFLSKDQGIEELTRELARLFDEIVF